MGGAAAVACMKLYVALGAKRENFWVYDSKGLVHESRNDLDELKKEFLAKGKNLSLAEALKDADVFIGLSKGGLLNKEMIKSMAKKSYCFCHGKSDPEISWEDATEARKDIIMATVEVIILIR